ncbi:hypothetical protein [Streptomyces sp. NPDC051098]|uniref:hypothetical protein n=1 Tax=Streptomyces sp. NPDC051098 TaxID=3155411 RepID=UPI00343351EA
MKSNKAPNSKDTWAAQIGRHLREHGKRHGRFVQRHALQGASTALGSGAVTLIIVWAQSRF